MWTRQLYLENKQVLINKKLRKITSFNLNTLKILINAFVISNLDYCNSLLYGIFNCVLDKLQKIINFAARVVTGAEKYEHIILHLKRLHWSPVKFRIHYKVSIMVFKGLNDLVPDYLGDLLKWYRLSVWDLRTSWCSVFLKFVIGWVIVVLLYGLVTNWNQRAD